MASVALVLVAMLAVLSAVLWRWKRRHLEKKAALLPGPPPWPLIGNILEVGLSTEDLYPSVFRLCAKYGSLFRLWLGPILVVVVSDPKNLKTILGNPKCVEKSNYYKIMRRAIGTGLVTAPGETWKIHRKIITPAFHIKVLENFLTVIEDKCKILIQKLEDKVDGPSFDIDPYISLFSLEVNIENVLGLHNNAQAQKVSSYGEALKVTLDTTMERMLCPWIYLDWMFDMSSVGIRSAKAIRAVHKEGRKMMKKKKEEVKKRLEVNNRTGNENNTELNEKYLPFLELLLEEQLTKGTLTDTEIEDEVDTFMAAGFETTATALGTVLWLLSTHQDVQDKLYEEIKDVYSRTTENAVTLQVLNDMKYLECVIDESLRLHPTIPLIGREVTEDLVLEGNVILPQSATIVIPIGIVHRNPDLYPKPDDFIPERFMDGNENCDNKFGHIPFSAGPRNCIGKKYATLSMKTTISKLLMRYKLLPDAEYTPYFRSAIALHFKNGISVKLSSRTA